MGAPFLGCPYKEGPSIWGPHQVSLFFWKLPLGVFRDNMWVMEGSGILGPSRVYLGLWRLAYIAVSQMGDLCRYPYDNLNHKLGTPIMINLQRQPYRGYIRIICGL